MLIKVEVTCRLDRAVTSQGMIIGSGPRVIMILLKASSPTASWSTGLRENNSPYASVRDPDSSRAVRRDARPSSYGDST